MAKSCTSYSKYMQKKRRIPRPGCLCHLSRTLARNRTIGSKSKINIEIRRSTTPGKRVILVQGPC
ncbi:hypothetical protein BDN70DRAFT_946069 [Pholiota conissans]|uniref:Uncharacterized protein n=1 Tax=Pholiota conissans TaxID=109636 RepID=A0A9P5Z112_9AGAR|nr:hypothetical protein BDN70DRAFT_946069 [Pholiota conissans]